MGHFTEKTLFTHHSSFNDENKLKPVYAFFALLESFENGVKALKVMVDDYHIWVEEIEFVDNLNEFIILHDHDAYDSFIKHIRKQLRGQKTYQADMVRFLLREANQRLES